ncbi:MAG: tRNA (guanosine(46)-N7)-methyltransferase TrmB [Halobacteriovoraceae bacterium]|nr:tRNA (guanosine(46)-N7)-methyltransferase TrmB [Halobacteriovoraceae bacterium]
MDLTYSENFVYRHDNPYHERLKAFDDFVLRDHEGESLAGRWREVFNRNAPLCVEVGSGYGHFMMEYCAKNPHINYVGMDYRFKRSFNLARKLNRHPVKNFKLLRARAERLALLFAKGEVDELFCFFPDPWPKARHNKRRILQDAFFQACHRVLKSSGKLYIKTDHEAYADWIEEIIVKNKLFDLHLSTRNLWKEHPHIFLCSFKTKFEKIFLTQDTPIKAYILSSREINNV